MEVVINDMKKLNIETSSCTSSHSSTSTHRLYKTKPCHNYKNCTRDRCDYYHSLNERKIAYCIYKDNCRNYNCKFCHTGQEDIWLRHNPPPEDMPETRVIPKKSHNWSDDIKLNVSDTPETTWFTDKEEKQDAMIITVDDDSSEEEKQDYSKDDDAISPESAWIQLRTALEIGKKNFDITINRNVPVEDVLKHIFKITYTEGCTHISMHV